MPTYEYECPDGHDFEKFQKMTDKPRAKCPVCGKPATRKISGGAGLVFKGSGFYITDYGKDGKGPRKAESRQAGRRVQAGCRRQGREAGHQAGAPSRRPEGRDQAGQEGRLRVSDALRAELARVAARLGADGVEFVLERPRDAATATSPPTSPWCSPSASAPTRARRPSGCSRSCSSRPSLVASDRDRRPRLHQLLAGRRTSSPRPTARILDAGRAPTAASTAGAGLKVNVEFVSANPDRPAARGPRPRAPRWATRIAALLEWTGHAVTREFYINDAGRPDRPAGAEPLGPGAARRRAARRRFPRAAITASTCRRTPRRCSTREGRAFADLPAEEGVRRSRGARAPRSSGRSRTATSPTSACASTSCPRSRRSTTAARSSARSTLLHERGLTYEADGALWLRTTEFGDDKDRVLRKSDGTLHLPRARHRLSHRQARARLRPRRSTSGAPITTATSRGCARCSRPSAIPPEFFDVALVQLVKVVRGGEEVKMSKRAGEFVTLRDLFEEVGVDAARYFFLMRQGASRRSTSTSTWPSGRPTRTRSSTCRWRTPG